MQSHTGSKYNASRDGVRAPLSLCLLLSILFALNAVEAPARPGAPCAVIELRAWISRPLVSTEFAATILSVSNEQALRLIESGSLLWAFDLSLKQGCRRPLIRVLSQSVADYLARIPAPKVLPDVRAIVDQVFPGHGAAITSVEISRQCGIDPDTVLNLWRAGELRLAKGSECKVGRGGSPQLDFASVADFMERRQVL